MHRLPRSGLFSGLVMATEFFALGAGAAMLLLPLLLRTLQDPEFSIWPTPVHGGWQSVVFWTLFRGLNLTAVATALTDVSGFLGLPDAVRIAGLVAFCASGALYLSALFALGRSNTYCEPEGLVTHGIYRWTRNPQYATIIPVFLSLAVAADSAMTTALCLALAAVYVLMALTEEPWLAAAYGDSYTRYCRRVPRFFNWHRAFVLAKTWARLLQRHAGRLLVPSGDELASGHGSRKRF